jgi:hypothetical protein
MCSSGPATTPIDASSTSVAVPPHVDPDSVMTVVTLPSAVMVPTQVPSGAAASSGVAQAARKTRGRPSR